MKNALQTAPLASPADARLVRRLEREYNRAICAEEDAPTERQAYRLATLSERCLRRLQAARAGLPMPELRMPRTARNLARQGFEALAMIGRVIGRALRTEAALRKAQAVGAARRVARQVARQVRQALRGAVRFISRLALNAIRIVTPIKENVMKAPTLAARIVAGQGHNYSEVSIDGKMLRFTLSPARGPSYQLGVSLRGDRFVFSGGAHGEHSLDADALITSADRLLAHWRGYCQNTERFFVGAAS